MLTRNVNTYLKINDGWQPVSRGRCQRFCWTASMTPTPPSPSCSASARRSWGRSSGRSWWRTGRSSLNTFLRRLTCLQQFYKSPQDNSQLLGCFNAKTNLTHLVETGKFQAVTMLNTNLDICIHQDMNVDVCIS